ncbi:MerR family transcriptional regulator, partial [Arthrobacter tecti]
MDWSIQEVSRLAGTTSRTLRHYDRVGLLSPSRVASNGYRYYDDGALVRLQRILLLRDLGLGLPAIADALGRNAKPTRALRKHLEPGFFMRVGLVAGLAVDSGLGVI